MISHKIHFKNEITKFTLTEIIIIVTVVVIIIGVQLQAIINYRNPAIFGEFGGEVFVCYQVLNCFFAFRILYFGMYA